MGEEQIKESTKQPFRSESTNRLNDLVKEQVERMESQKQSKVSKNTESELQPEPSISSEITESATPSVPPESTEPTRRISSKQRKASLDEYREQFLRTPKITDRQPVFVSRAIRDCIDELVRRLGERRMSVSGFLENLANHHLETYKEEIEQWKRL